MLSREQIEAFRRGDEEAVRTVYGAYSRMVFAVCHRLLGDRSLAQDAAQQTFVQAWRAAASLDPDREPGPWLVTIARRVAIDVHRREARRAHESLDAPDAARVVSLPPDIEQAYTVWQVREVLDSLDADDRELVRLHHLEGHTHRDIAERLDIPIGTVKSRSFRIHRLLASRLGHLRDVPAQPP